MHTTHLPVSPMTSQDKMMSAQAAAAGNAPAARHHIPAWEGHPVLDACLVLEGGGMRGQFSAGVIDCLMDNGIVCRNAIGTSAGSLAASYYAAGEIGRACYINLKYAGDPRYFSMNNFARTGSAMDVEFMFHTIPDVLEPFDYDGFDRSPISVTAVSSNIESGEADYHTLSDSHDTRYLVASCSVPLISKIVEVDGKKLLDGGNCDSVPLLYAMLRWPESKKIVVLTHDAGFVREPNKTMALYRAVYHDYPYFVERAAHRHFEYNRTYRRVARLHAEGKVFCIQPAVPVTISNMEKDREKLFDLYEQGYAVTTSQLDALKAYLER